MTYKELAEKIYNQMTNRIKKNYTVKVHDILEELYKEGLNDNNLEEALILHEIRDLELIFQTSDASEEDILEELANLFEEPSN